MKVQSTAEKMMQIDEVKKKVEEARTEELNELRKCANRIFASKDGKFWAKRAINWLGVNKRDRGVFSNPVLLAAQEANRHFFLAFFKELLDPEVLLNIERGERQ
jgi:hypothetical protein